MTAILHPAGLRWLRRKSLWLAVAVLALMVAQWFLASRLAVMAASPAVEGMARTRVDTTQSDTGQKLVLSSTWRLQGCTVRERVVFDAGRAFVHPDLPEDEYGVDGLTVHYVGPCLVVKPMNPLPAPSVGFTDFPSSPITAPFRNTSRAVLGSLDGSDHPRVETWSSSEWQSELVTGWPLAWLSYRFESDTMMWPERDRFKPVGGMYLIDNTKTDMHEVSEFGMETSAHCAPYPSRGMLATRVRWMPLVGELLLAGTLVTGVAYAGWWMCTYQIRRRLRLGLCVTCGYDMKGESGVCHECGKPAQIHRRFGVLDA